ncbi:MAG TPA: FG-GAP-like repeat-containing protein [Pyrinomonadaceae bacterium]|jgi:Tol biopolymer transport system component
MKNYPLAVMSSSRRLMLVVGLSLIGLFFLFPAQSVERRVRSAQPEANLIVVKLAYTFSRTMIGGTFTNIYTANADGARQTRITPGFAFDGYPTWSPDGSKIVFSRGAIWVMDANGTNPINLGVGGRSPSWSVTGKIAYESGGQIWTMNPDGSNQAPFHGITQPTPMRPDWSSDGSKLAFSSGGNIWVINADGTNERQVATSDVADNAPAWSPDGLKIAFSKREPSTFPSGTVATVIHVINVDGTNEVRLTMPTQGNVNDTGPAWSPDNTKIAFAKNGATGEAGIHIMNTDGTNQTRIVFGGAGSGCFDPAWQPIAPVPRPRLKQFDFDGDGRADLSLFRPSEGAWYLRGSQSGSHVMRWGRANDKLVPADYDGDFKTDLAVWRVVGADGVFYILNSSDNTFRSEVFGLAGDDPMPSDWDGDGKDDLAVYSNGAQAGEQSSFYYRGSANNPNGNITFVPWGIAGDRPVLGDFDGDRRTDAAVFRTSNQTWYVRASSSGQLLVTVFVSGGFPTDLVAADYDADGKTDLAMHTAGGAWYIYLPQGVRSSLLPATADFTPAPADYDGDGRAETVVFSNGDWRLYNDFQGTQATVQFGVAGDKPVPAAYVR